MTYEKEYTLIEALYEVEKDHSLVFISSKQNGGFYRVRFDNEKLSIVYEFTNKYPEGWEIALYSINKYFSDGFKYIKQEKTREYMTFMEALQLKHDDRKLNVFYENSYGMCFLLRYNDSLRLSYKSCCNRDKCECEGIAYVGLTFEIVLQKKWFVDEREEL